MTSSPVPAPAAVEMDGSGKHPCACSDGCPGRTTRTFSQGHDARLVTRLRNQVVAGELAATEAMAELQRRGGLDGLYFKLETAINNAVTKAAERARRQADRAAAKAEGRATRKARKLETFELGEFCLAAMPIASSTNIVAKVGRWEYRGEILTYQIVEDGRISKGDTVDVFEYRNKKDERQQTLTYSRVKVDEEFEAAARAANGAEVPQVAVEAAAPEQFADIPF